MNRFYKWQNKQWIELKKEEYDSSKYIIGCYKMSCYGSIVYIYNNKKYGSYVHDTHGFDNVLKCYFWYSRTLK